MSRGAILVLRGCTPSVWARRAAADFVGHCAVALAWHHIGDAAAAGVRADMVLPGHPADMAPWTTHAAPMQGDRVVVGSVVRRPLCSCSVCACVCVCARGSMAVACAESLRGIVLGD